MALFRETFSLEAKGKDCLCRVWQSVCVQAAAEVTMLWGKDSWLRKVCTIEAFLLSQHRRRRRRASQPQRTNRHNFVRHEALLRNLLTQSEWFDGQDVKTAGNEFTAAPWRMVGCVWGLHVTVWQSCVWKRVVRFCLVCHVTVEMYFCLFKFVCVGKFDNSLSVSHLFTYCQ